MPSVRVTPNRLHADEHNTKQNFTAKGRNKVHAHTHTSLTLHTDTKKIRRSYRESQAAVGGEKVKRFLPF